jgi:hypothetical protein
MRAAWIVFFCTLSAFPVPFPSEAILEIPFSIDNFVIYSPGNTLPHTAVYHVASMDLTGDFAGWIESPDASARTPVHMSTMYVNHGYKVWESDLLLWEGDIGVIGFSIPLIDGLLQGNRGILKVKNTGLDVMLGIPFRPYTFRDGVGLANDVYSLGSGLSDSRIVEASAATPEPALTAVIGLGLGALLFRLRQRLTRALP